MDLVRTLLFFQLCRCADSWCFHNVSEVIWQNSRGVCVEEIEFCQLDLVSIKGVQIQTETPKMNTLLKSIFFDNNTERTVVLCSYECLTIWPTHGFPCRNQQERSTLGSVYPGTALRQAHLEVFNDTLRSSVEPGMKISPWLTARK